jgi:hypothetical protein
MRINVYTEELLAIGDTLPMCEITATKYVSSRTGKEMTNYGFRIFIKSPPELHYVPGRDDDRSAITFWVGSDRNHIIRLLEVFKQTAERSNV